MQKEKGNIALLILVLILVVGLALGLFLVQQKTNLFSKAYSPSQPKQTESADQEQYQNPFDDTSSKNNSTDIFSGYQNPFEGLK